MSASKTRDLNTPHNQTILLSNRQEDIPLKAADGKVACIVGEWVITSPNSNFIPLRGWGTADVRLRADFRYGADDFTLWPQDYIIEYCHLAAIPRKPSSRLHPLSIMWWNPGEEDFTQLTGSLHNGFGLLERTKYGEIERLCKALSSEVQEYLKSTNQQNHTLRALLKTLEHSCSRLDWCTSTYLEMRFAITEAQRYYLEVRGLLDYLKIFKPRMDGISEPEIDVSTTSRIGAFTSRPEVVQEFVDAGLPVYYIRPFAAVAASPPNILQIIEPLPPGTSIEISDAEPPFPVIFRGPTNAPAKHAAMHRYTRTWMIHQDPHSDLSSPNSVDPFLITGPLPNASRVRLMDDLLKEQLPTDASPTEKHDDRTTLSSSSRVPDATAKDLAIPLTNEAASSVPALTSKGSPSFKLQIQENAKSTQKSQPQKPRDPFKEVISPLLPQLPSYWATALGRVSREKKRVIAGHRPGFHCYALPDPHIFLSGSNEKRTMYLLGWIRARPLLLHQLKRRMRLQLKTQNWRDFLEMIGRNTGKSEGSLAAKSRDKVSDFFGDILQTIGPLPESTTLASVAWGSHSLSSSHLPPTDVFREVLWEINEVNFRIEVLALDEVATTLNIGSSERYLRVAECFYDDTFFPLNIPTRNHGFATRQWTARIPFTMSLVRILRTWYNSPSILRRVTTTEFDGNFTDEFRFYDIEDAAADFYCQTFWNYFERAPILPRRLYQ